MSFTNLSYDSCSYDKYLEESIGAGNYMLSTPTNSDGKKQCFFKSPYVRLDKTNVGLCKDRSLIDVDSELLGLNMKNSECPEKRTFDSQYCKNTPLEDCNDDFMSPEDTKLSNPPCTLRGTGWNRWEWLCNNPQDLALVPFEREIQNRMIVKDNHRPCIPDVSKINGDDVMPISRDDLSCYTDQDVAKMYNEKDVIPFIHWRSCDEIRRL